MTPATFLTCAAATADPTRLRMLFQLGAGPRSVGQLAEGCAVTSSAISYHLRRLRGADLVVVHRAGRRTLVRRVETRWAAIAEALTGPGEPALP